MKRESKFHTLFRHWLRANATLFDSCAFELKQTTKDSIPFSDLAKHQAIGLDAAQQVDSGIFYKAPDDSRGSKPFDFFYLRDADAYVVIRFPKCFCVIDFDDYRDEEKASERRSLTSDRARQIAKITVDL